MYTDETYFLLQPDDELMTIPQCAKAFAGNVEFIRSVVLECQLPARDVGGLKIVHKPDWNAFKVRWYRRFRPREFPAGPTLRADEERKTFAHDGHEGLLTITNVARRLGIDYRMAIELAAQGDLTATYIGGRIIVREKHLESFTRRRAEIDEYMAYLDDMDHLKAVGEPDEIDMPF